MSYRFDEKFEKDKGFRYYRDKVSILVQAAGYGRRLTDAQMADFARAINKYRNDIEDRKSPFLGYRKALTEADFSDLNAEPLYKYVSESTWKYISYGSIQLGTAEYYRTTPNINVQDRREGASIFHLSHNDNQLHMGIISGFNCALFCGTTFLTGAEHDLMLNRFGKKRIKIEPLTDFIAIIQKHIKSFSARAHDIVYSDLKHYIAECEDVERYWEIASSGGSTDLNPEKNRKINETFFESFYQYGFMPSLFSKPTAYSGERERRIVFEFKKDVRRPVIVVDDKSLLDCITVIDG